MNSPLTMARDDDEKREAKNENGEVQNATDWQSKYEQSDEMNINLYCFTE
jgi:hypothetical protein